MNRRAGLMERALEAAGTPPSEPGLRYILPLEWMWQESVQVAALAILEGQDPVERVHSFTRFERHEMRVHAPLEVLTLELDR
jgi:hypothetical protein